MLKIDPIETSIFEAGMNLPEFVFQQTQPLVGPGQILAITTKIVSLAENRIVPKGHFEKLDLIKKESDIYLGKSVWGTHITIKENLLLASAGIDESNSVEGNYILFPRDPFSSAKALHLSLSKLYGFSNFGILLTDSRTSPLRRGVTGVSVAYYGFRGLDDRRGDRDIFSSPLKVTQINRADALSAAAVLAMGEGAEQTPLALITDPKAVFENQMDNSELRVNPKEDLYLAVISSFSEEY